jgi:hypothetical protein
VPRQALLFGEALMALEEVHSDPAGKCCFREVTAAYLLPLQRGHKSDGHNAWPSWANSCVVSKPSMWVLKPTCPGSAFTRTHSNTVTVDWKYSPNST